MQRPITDTLKDLGHGSFIDEASDALNKLVAAVSDTGRGGKLTLTLSVKKATRGSGAMIVQDEIKLSLPKQEARETMLFATPENNLTTEDPRQQRLELKSVPASLAAASSDLKTIPPQADQLKVVA
ncbi:hypothetical protein LH427_01955 [Laribacter hongkongensis]|uniref:hypothetical protein n=1 Tax=Laribacter hongkongensis TaxID=168471 RepID=UPI001EFDB9B8|nr:hypothetical protein [Laribacter hongkongensis]MCG8991790.1 hypothetical protein [Laribacter hongkongensis]MCG8998715.1 hypothetical protein [Laribacter hongkongensis]MCG9000211.1 hypothetical protein [Laribacter hongkongensis]MCG9004432.1 hypothetical protein [Laribacter hongkongensis]MCG9006601.1 hypothetical protein [Laribacter hongkongensis]